MRITIAMLSHILCYHHNHLGRVLDNVEVNFTVEKLVRFVARRDRTLNSSSGSYILCKQNINN